MNSSEGLAHEVDWLDTRSYPGWWGPEPEERTDDGVEPVVSVWAAGELAEGWRERLWAWAEDRFQLLQPVVAAHFDQPRERPSGGLADYESRIDAMTVGGRLTSGAAETRRVGRAAKAWGAGDLEKVTRSWERVDLEGVAHVPALAVVIEMAESRSWSAVSGRYERIPHWVAQVKLSRRPEGSNPPSAVVLDQVVDSMAALAPRLVVGARVAQSPTITTAREEGGVLLPILPQEALPVERRLLAFEPERLWWRDEVPGLAERLVVNEVHLERVGGPDVLADAGFTVTPVGSGGLVALRPGVDGSELTQDVLVAARLALAPVLSRGWTLAGPPPWGGGLEPTVWLAGEPTVAETPAVQLLADAVVTAVKIPGERIVNLDYGLHEDLDVVIEPDPANELTRTVAIERRREPTEDEEQHLRFVLERWSELAQRGLLGPPTPNTISAIEDDWDADPPGRLVFTFELHATALAIPMIETLLWVVNAVGAQNAREQPWLRSVTIT